MIINQSLTYFLCRTTKLHFQQLAPREIRLLFQLLKSLLSKHSFPTPSLTFAISFGKYWTKESKWVRVKGSKRLDGISVIAQPGFPEIGYPQLCLVLMRRLTLSHLGIYPVWGINSTLASKVWTFYKWWRWELKPPLIKYFTGSLRRSPAKMLRAKSMSFGTFARSPDSESTGKSSRSSTRLHFSGNSSPSILTQSSNCTTERSSISASSNDGIAFTWIQNWNSISKLKFSI